MKMSKKEFNRVMKMFEKSKPDLSGRLLTCVIGISPQMSAQTFNEVLDGFEDISIRLQMLELFDFEKYFNSELLLKHICYIMCEFEDVISEITNYLIATFHVLRKIAIATQD